MNLPIVITPGVAKARGLVPEASQGAQLGRWRVSYRKAPERGKQLCSVRGVAFTAIGRSEGFRGQCRRRVSTHARGSEGPEDAQLA
jgi:hypothetical protein